jgi:tRNA nucleotidyltransferase (CCA-adding enzyme)
MSDSIQKIKEKVAAGVLPTMGDREEVERVLRKVSSRIKAEAEARGLEVRAEVEGSIAKDTWIRTDRDIDIFIIFEGGTDKEAAKSQGLELAKAAGGNNWKLGFAEHPYVEAVVDGFTLDIVPSIEMGEGESPITSVDRTPLHTVFMNGKLTEKTKSDIRVLKQFMKGIGVYGAELRVGGFSGYLCELLVLNYGGFESLIASAARWCSRTSIDLMGFYRGVTALEAFDSPLVAIDPVDRRRNVAAAVSSQSYHTFIAASRCFVKEPKLEFFFPKTERANPQENSKLILAKGSTVVGIVVNCPAPMLPDDVLWGEVQKSLTRITSILGSTSFEVNGFTAWSDGKVIVFLVEVLEGEISSIKVHRGPEVTFGEESERFLTKYSRDPRVLAGPYIRDEHWFVELRREPTGIRDMIKRELPKMKLSRDIEKEVGRGFGIYVNGELEELSRDREGLGTCITNLVRKRPLWLT